jgi:hypothetical protein
MLHTIPITQSQATAVIQGAYDWILSRIGEEQHGAEQTYLSGDAAAVPHAPFQLWLPTEPPVEDWLKFQDLVPQWKSERRAMSSITEIALCPAYQSIIGMGEAAVPFIMKQLVLEGNDPDQWFWALRAITGADPVKDEDRGNHLKMAQAWLQWARNRYAN